MALVGAVATTAVALGLVGPGAGSALAAVGPNGLIAYSSWNDQLDYDIYVVDPAQPGLQPIRLTTDGAYNGNPDWSPDGSKIAFDGWAEFGGPRIQVMDIDPATDDQTVLTDPAGGYGDFQPAWSPNGTRIAFVSSRTDGQSEDWGYEIYVMDATGEVGPLIDATRLTTDAFDPETGRSIEDSQVTWSPDGSRLAFVSTGRGLDPDACDLWVMDSVDRDGDGVGDNLHQITFDESFNCDPFEDITPQWSPNSGLIAFTSVRSGYFDIWLVNANDPTDLRNVTQTPGGYEDQPSWSPDGTQVIFRSAASGQYELYALPVQIGRASCRERV
jgi:Periplasmic component of the Tol biopolymer transport system